LALVYKWKCNWPKTCRSRFSSWGFTYR